MKLKKIASLMLAGIMAVSMLAGCKSGENGGNGSGENPDVTPTSNYTSSILENTNYAKRFMDATPNAKLDNAVAFAARNNSINTGKIALTYINSNTGYVADAKSFMGNAMYAVADMTVKQDLDGDGKPENNLDKGTKTVTYYAFYEVTRKYDDQKIDNLVADLMDNIAGKQVGILEEADGDTRAYSVSIAKADSWKNKKAANANADSVIVGIAVTMTYTEAKF